jgi:WD40 repeat protein/uncharacterized caspase-like protein
MMHTEPNRETKAVPMSWLSEFIFPLIVFGMSLSILGTQRPPIDSRPRPMLVLQKGGTLSAVGIAASPDGSWFASEEQSGAITIWSSDDGSEYRTFQPFNAYSKFALPGHIAVASDSSTIAIAAGDTLYLVDSMTTQERRHFPIDSYTWEIRAHPTEPILATVDMQGNASIISLKDGHLLFHIQLRTDMYSGGSPSLKVRFSPDGALLAVLTDYEFQLWDWAQNKQLFVYDAHSFHSPTLAREVTWQDGHVTKKSTAEERHLYWFHGVCFSPDGRHLALAASDELTILELPSGRKSASIPIEKGSVRDCFFTDDDLVLTQQTDSEATVYTLSKASVRVASNLYLQDYIALRGRNRAVVLSSFPYLITADKFEVLKAMNPEVRSPTTLVFQPGGRSLLWATYFKPLTSWDMTSGDAATKFPQAGTMPFFTVSANGKYLAESDQISGKIRVFDLENDREENPLPVKFESFLDSISISSDGRVLASSQPSGEVHIFSVETRREIASLSADNPTSIAVEPDGKYFALADTTGTHIYAVSPMPQKIISLAPSSKGTAPYGLRYSPDGKLLAVMDVAGIRLISTETWKSVQSISDSANLCIAFSPDSKVIAFASRANGIEIKNLTTTKVVFQDQSHLSSCPAAFSTDGKIVAAATEYGAQLFLAETGADLASLYLFGGDKQLDWLVVTADGLFDGTPAAWKQLKWRFSNNTFDVAPVELFFRDFFHPGLFAEVASGDVPRAPVDIASLDQRQPSVKLALADGITIANPIGDRRVAVRVKVAGVPADADHKGIASGASDVRLFRNGTLVRFWHGDVLNGKNNTILEADVAITAGENLLTAYAFNHDNIKSADASLSLTGSKTLTRKGIAYILAVGINDYPNHDFKLNYAVADAIDFGEEIREQQERLATYNKDVVVPLEDSAATRVNFLYALRRLAGKESSSLPMGAPGQLAQLQPAQPEDGIFLYFAGHGTAVGDGFYMVPFDFGYNGTRAGLDAAVLTTIASHSVSDKDLEDAFEGIDAGRIVLVIDACNSGQALEAEEKRRGPMNSKGLAQLAYEKGMYILTAAQGYQQAQEISRLGHGLLTYALVDEGLKLGNASSSDGKIYLREWLDYAAREVPRLQTQWVQGPLSRGFLEASGNTVKPRDPSQIGLQRPRVFYRREPEASPTIVGSK